MGEEREIARLADGEVAPLDNDDRHEVSALGIPERLRAVADGLVADPRLVPVLALSEVTEGEFGVGGVHVEYSSIFFIICRAVPVKTSILRVICVTTLDLVQSEEKVRREAIVLHHPEVSIEASDSLHDSDLEVREGDKLRVNQVVHLSVTRLASHDIELCVLVGEGDSGDHIGAKVNTEDEHS